MNSPLRYVLYRKSFAYSFRILLRKVDIPEEVNLDLLFPEKELKIKSKFIRFDTEDKITVYLKYKSEKKGLKGNFGYGIFREDSIHCYGTNVSIECDDFVPIEESGEVSVTFQNSLLPGKYFLDVAVHSHDGIIFDDIRRVQSFVVSSSKRDIGVCRLQSEWSVNGKIFKKGVK